MNKNQSVLIACISFLLFGVLFSAENNTNNVQSLVYSHGFGDCGPSSPLAVTVAKKFKIKGGISGPTYLSDADGERLLYGKPAVMKLVKHLKEEVEKGKRNIHLVGHSCGGGTILNALKKLVDYENSKNYFEQSGITSQDADAIIAAINKGSLCISAPLLDVRRTIHFQAISCLLTGLSSIVGLCLFYAKYNTFNPLVFSDIESSCNNFGFEQRMCSNLITYGPYWIVPTFMYLAKSMGEMGLGLILTQAPIDGLDVLKGKLTCPILIHVNRWDGMVQVTDDDKKRLCSAFSNGKMKLLVTNDRCNVHNQQSRQLNKELGLFGSTYFNKS